MILKNVFRRLAAAVSRAAAHALVVSFALVVPCASARAQGGGLDPNASYRLLMERRMEMSKRSVDETLRRRFEEGKSEGPFPSDANKAAARAGVVRAASPEEQKALAHNEKGLDYFSKNKFEQAVKEYDEALRLYPGLAAAHNNLGSAYFSLGRFAEAASAFRQATEVEPNYGQAHFNLGLAYLKLGREKEANDSLMGAVRAYLVTGAEHLRGGRLKEAEESFKGVLQIDPDYSVAHLNLGLVYNAERRYEEAAAAFRRVLRQEPKDADAQEGLAESCLGLRKYREAVESSEQAIKLQPESRAAYYFNGLAHASLAEREPALAALDKLRELHAADYAALLSDFIEKKAPAQK
jgi:tetratricopeptide (TPR) repeat protein